MSSSFSEYTDVDCGRTSWLFAAASLVVLLGPPPSGGAHPGGTDDEGCHTCRSNCEKWEEARGERHCHGDSDDETSEGESSERKKSERRATQEDELELSEGERAYVEKVLDGDTLVVRPLSQAEREVRIRVLGIDCPESHVNPKCRREGRNGEAGCAEQIPRGRRAAERAAELVKREVVRLESEGGDGAFERGDYDRLLAYIRIDDGRDFGKVLVEEGFCQDYGDTFPHPRHEAYERAE